MARNDDNEGLGENVKDYNDDELEIREATVVSVLWERPGNDWKKLKMSDGTIWVGVTDTNVGVGSVIEASGYIRRDKYNKLNFNLVDVINILPYSPEGLLMWLQDRLPNIGPERAKALVEHFPGEELFDTIRQNPEALTKISGITPERAVEIATAFAKYSSELHVVRALTDLGVDYRRAQKVAKQYRDLNVLQQQLADDPFELVDVDDWSFKLVRRLVLGYLHGLVPNPYLMEPNDPRLVRAYLREMLRVAAGIKTISRPGKNDDPRDAVDNPYEDMGRDGGDCFLDAPNFLTMLRSFYNGYVLDGNGRPTNRRHPGIYSSKQLGEIARSSRHIKVYETGLQVFPKGAVMLNELDSAEDTVAKVIRGKLRNWDNAVQTEMVELPEHLDESQKVAVQALAFAPIAVMTGGPGVGKTTTLKAALDVMESRGERIKLASPTGKAAKRMAESTGRPAQTVHKLLEWTPDGFQRDQNNPIDASVVVIDESSMLDVELAASLFAAVGSARIILVGDEDQLSPVGPGQVLTDVMRSGVVPTYRLTKTYRQGADSWVIDNARRIINGEMPDLHGPDASRPDFAFIEQSRSDDIIRTVINIYHETKRGGEGNQLQVLVPIKLKGRGASAYEINVAVQEELNPNAYKDNPESARGGEYMLYVGDKVIYTKNTPKLGLVNGDMGFIKKISETKKNKIVSVEFEGLKNENSSDGLFHLQDSEFKPLLLAYAMTVHKSQGSEWKRVVVVADPQHSRMLKRQLLYTAVTRTSKVLRIVGSRQAIDAARRSPRQTNRWTQLSNRIRGEL